MNNRIDSSEIKLWIHEIIDTIGLREPVNYSYFKKFTKKNKLPELIKSIARYMNLPIKIDVEFVNDEYKTGKVNFETKGVAHYEGGGQGASGIIAQVEIPSNLPLYGTDALNNYLIKVKVSDNCLKSPQMFVTIMSHELSHILLNSLRHKNKENEFFTDLTAMTLGFVNIFSKGRTYIYETEENHILSSTITTHKQTCGYLSDNQFRFACELINKNIMGYRMSVEKLKNKCVKFEKLYKSYVRLFKNFSKYKLILDKNCSTKFNQKDISRIMLIHQVGYIDNYNDILNKTNIFEQVNSKMEKILNKDLYIKKEIIDCDQLVIGVIDNLEKNIHLLKEDIRIIGSYIKIPNKIKILFGIT